MFDHVFVMPNHCNYNGDPNLRSHVDMFTRRARRCHVAYAHQLR